MKTYQSLLLGFLLLPLSALAQNAVTYSGPKVCFQANTLKVTKIGKLDGVPKESYQGMDIWGNNLVSLQNSGMATVYNFDGKTLKKKGSFPLGSRHNTNHSNLASFSNNWYNKADKMPLLYVSRCNSTVLNGMDKLFFGERIDPDGLKSELVQTIWLNDYKHCFGGYALGCIDRETNMFYVYAETTDHTHPESNKHWVMKFRMPEYKGPQDSLVILTEDDAIDKYYMEDTYTFAHQPITQGACAAKGLLFLPMGFGTAQEPSVLYVINTANHSVQNVIDMQGAMPIEMEDCTEYQGDLIVQCQGAVYKISF